MNVGALRPALPLLGSILPDERVGHPGSAREDALTAARADPPNAHVQLLDAALASLVAGEPRTAARLVDECEAAAPRNDETWRRRVAAFRAWAWTLDWNWYPGDSGAELGRTDAPPLPPDLPGDPETRLFEAAANAAATILFLRYAVEGQGRANAPNAAELALGAIVTMQRAVAALDQMGMKASETTPAVAYADVLRRAGRHEQADAELAAARTLQEGLRGQGVVHPTALANTYLLEGDWYSAPGSSPEALGLDLATQTQPSPFLGLRDLDRATAAYDRAATLLEGVDEPRAQGALALRRAALAWLGGDHETQLDLLDAAARAFADAGDAASSWLVVVHRLVAELALGRCAGVRRAAGSGFDLEPRGVAADLLRWSEQDGSASWTTGLGRLLQRAGALWETRGDPERAAVAYEVAAPLVSVSGVESSSTVLLSLAAAERQNGIAVRTLTRCRVALSTLPAIEDAEKQSVDWGRSIDVVLDVARSYQDTSASAAGVNIPALEWAVARAMELLAVPGVPSPGSGEDLETIRQKLEARTLADQMDEASGDDVGRLLRGTQADTARAVAGLAEAYASLQRGIQAAAIGASEPAERWYDDAVEKLAALPPEYAPVAVIVWAARDRFDEAQSRLRELLDRPGQSLDLLASAAVRAHDYETARRLFDRLGKAGASWVDLLDRGEAELGAGRAEAAVLLTEAAVQGFEQRFDRLTRDVDRVSASDDVKVSALYLQAARAHLALAEGLGAAPRAEATARAFALSDRARALALAALLGDVDGGPSFLKWRRRTYEWQAAHERLLRAYAADAGAEEVGARIHDLAAAEDELVELEAEREASLAGRRRPARRELPGLAEVQAALPPDAAVVEYQHVDRDLLVWTITRTTAQAAASRHPTGLISRLAKAVQGGCANGRPGPEAEELAELLIGPAASVLDGCGRVIVVPYGVLHGLPFHVLPRGGRALGETHVLSYLPAAALLAGATVDSPGAVGPALVVGDPAFDPARHPSLRRLPGAAVEARAIAATHGAHPLVGADAVEDAIRTEMGRAQLVHLAAHGRLDPVAPSDSSIVLAGGDELTVSDLVGVRIDAELAVLSACDSGRGAASLGGDVVGLARGLIAAGARRSVVSLWPVDDAPACVTMSLFHERLAAGLPAAAALHESQATVRGLSGAELGARYVELGGDHAHASTTRRRGAPTPELAPKLELVEDFVDDVDDDEPLADLGGDLPRIWAPFVVLGV